MCYFYPCMNIPNLTYKSTHRLYRFYSILFTINSNIIDRLKGFVAKLISESHTTAVNSLIKAVVACSIDVYLNVISQVCVFYIKWLACKCVCLLNYWMVKLRLGLLFLFLIRWNFEAVGVWKRCWKSVGNLLVYFL